MNALLRESTFGMRLVATTPVADWGLWTRSFLQVELARHGRSAGWIDTGFYGSVERFLDDRGAPEDVRATVALLRNLRTFEFAAAAEAADRLGATTGRAGALPPQLMLEACVGAYLGAGRKDDARAAFEALAPATELPTSDARLLWLAALVGAEPPGPAPR